MCRLFIHTSVDITVALPLTTIFETTKFQDVKNKALSNALFYMSVHFVL